MSNIINSAKYASRFESMFKCPICHSPMKVVELKSIVCSNKHTFDFAKQGYLNLTTHPVKNKYSKDLFEARRKVIAEVGFFHPVTKAIVEIVAKYKDEESISLIDMGCGEGSHLVQICDQLLTDEKKAVMAVGIDLAKEGILVAARNDQEKIWAVADLANTPFKDKQFDVILNILSPSNYGEFHRVLKEDGCVIKVVPQKGYLKELREAFFGDSDKQEYSNAEIVERFKENYREVSSQKVHYSVTLDEESLQSLIQMTPLTWNLTPEQVSSFSAKNLSEITVELEILIGKGKLN